MDEPALLRAAVAGDSTALTELLRGHAPALRAQLQIAPQWQSTLDADDILQVTYFEAFLRIASFEDHGPGSFFGWLRRIANNNLRDAIKGLERQKRPPANRQVRAAPGDSVVELFELMGVTTTTPSRDVAGAEMKSALDVALEALPADYAQVIRAYDLAGRPIAEVAAMVGRSAGAVHMLRARAHDRLRELIGANPFFSVGE